MGRPLLAGVVMLGLLSVPAAATTVSPSAGAAATAVDVRDVAVQVTVERRNATAVAYHLSVSFPPGARAGRVLPYSGAVTRADGFGLARDARTLVWLGAPNASLTVVSDVRRAAAAGCTCVATDDWLLAVPVRVQVSVRQGRAWHSAYLTDWLSDSTVAADVTVEGGLFLPGAVLLGDASVAETTTPTGERIRVVTPAAATDAPDEAAVLDAMARASAGLDVGPPPEDAVTAVVVPDVEAHAAHVDTMDDRGRAVGNGYVYLDEDADATTWIHEYVHTRQTYSAAADMRWFTEATAEYYGNYFAAGPGEDPLRFVDDRLGDVERAEPVLAAPETWDSRSVPYRQGGRVVAHLDRRVRAETGGDRTFLDVFRRLNGREDVTVSDLEDATAAVVGSRALDAEIARYVTASAPPDRNATDDRARAGQSGNATPDGPLDLPTIDSSTGVVHRRIIDAATGFAVPSALAGPAIAVLLALLAAVVLRR